MDENMIQNKTEIFAICAEKTQQYWYEHLADRDWDRYSTDDHYYLKLNIGFALFGLPSQVPRQANTDNDLGYTKDQYKQIIKIHKLLLKHNYVEEANVILVRVIFIIGVLKESELKEGKYLSYLTYSWKKKEETEKFEEIRRKNRLIQVPLFVIKKCHCVQNPKSPNLCNIFIDNDGRVYQSWQLFLEENKLPKCDMYCPLNGRYSGRIVGMNVDKTDGEMVVNLEVHESPACGVGQKVLSITDTTGTVVSLGATGVFLAQAVPGIAVAPVAIAGAGVACATVAVYAVGRSIAELVDRGKHKQKIGLDDAEARNCWINVAAASVSTVAGAASSLLSRTVANGKVIGNGTRLAFNASQITALASSGVALGNSAYLTVMKMCEDQEISALDVFQFSSSVLFLCKSAVRFKTASTIINETRANILKDYQDTLRSNRHRKIFNKALAETIHVNGVEQGTAEVISSIRNIQDKDNFFAGLARRNKEFNQKNVKFTLTSNGQVLLNNIHTIDPAEFADLPASERNGLLSNLIPQKPEVPTDAFFTTKTTVTNWIDGKITTTTQIKICSEAIKLLTTLISANFLGQEAVEYIIVIFIEFKNKLELVILDRLRQIFPLVDANMAVLQFVKYYLQEISSTKQLSLINTMKMVINPDGTVQEHFLMSIKAKLQKWMETLERCNQTAVPFITKPKSLISCAVCKGHYWIIQ